MIFSFFKVSGHSMEPFLNENEYVFAVGFLSIKKGDVVVFNKNSKHFIKRITRIINDKVFLEGDNKNDSFDSRKFGEIEKRDIIGKVVLKI